MSPFIYGKGVTDEITYLGLVPFVGCLRVSFVLFSVCCFCRDYEVAVFLNYAVDPGNVW